ncbi:MAG: RusA family crossover junction endodeoxyribonuclease, partial [Xanthomarina gelatinilytica]|nr:RusA family crossover junction endodeoxyribonuclease [Xanthomarina gelatinilytica]
MKLDEESTLTIDLPWPPSVNHYWSMRSAGTRIIKFVGKKGKLFREDVIERTKDLLPHCDKYFNSKAHRLAVTVDIYPPDRRRRDIDNLSKALLDALEHASVYEDDTQIDYLVLKRCTKVEEGAV